MDWDDVEDILFCGTVEEIKKVSCPDCGGMISYSFSASANRMTIECAFCGYLAVLCKCAEVPNCAKMKNGGDRLNE